MHNPTVIELDLTHVPADDGATHAMACWELSNDGRLQYRLTVTDECCCRACMLAIALVDEIEDLDRDHADAYVRFIRGAVA
jgi:hypothetical protein